MQTARPVFLDLWRIRLPWPALVSILHRVSGVMLVLAIPVVAILFATALSGPEGFAAVAGFLGNPLIRLGLLLMIWALLHHLLAGLRFLAIDLGIGVDKPMAGKTARYALYGALGLTVIGGGMLL